MNQVAKKLNVVRLSGMPILKQLQFEEMLLRQTTENWFVMNNGMPGLSIVLGFSGKIVELVDSNRVESAKMNDNKDIELIRRYTGGGTVIVDKSTFFSSFIMNNVDVPSRPYPREIMDWTETVFKPVFENEVLTSKATFALRENDYILDDLKIGGNAQTIIKDRWVHHTSFLWDYEASNMEFLLMPKKRPKYREDRDHKSFLDKIKRHIPTVIDFENLIVDELSKKYEVKVIDSDEAEALRLGLIPSAKDVRTKVI